MASHSLVVENSRPVFGAIWGAGSPVHISC
jgi:hypothetical protein